MSPQRCTRSGTRASPNPGAIGRGSGHNHRRRQLKTPCNRVARTAAIVVGMPHWSFSKVTTGTGAMAASATISVTTAPATLIRLYTETSVTLSPHTGGSTAIAIAIVHFGRVGRLWVFLSAFKPPRRVLAPAALELPPSPGCVLWATCAMLDVLACI
eukprot:scaffold154_cov37-Phaeocystis_antarctica.AAC.2